MAIVVHVTHEAVHQAGGIGSVLSGLITAPSYAARIERTILVGPLSDPETSEPLGPEGQLLYDSGRGLWNAQVGPGLSRVAGQFGVRLVYGRRRLRGDSGEAFPEILLVDVSRPPAGLDVFKYYLAEHFGLDSRRYEWIWEYEQYLRLGEPGFEGVSALIGPAAGPCYLIAHEFMGMGLIFKAMLMQDRRFRTLFYAHEVATVRPIVEESPGRDLMFYNVLRKAREQKIYLEEVFGPQDHYFKHALIRQAWRCDGVLAVGDWVVEELRFLGPEFANRRIDLVYNGLPAVEIGPEVREIVHRRLQEYAGSLLRFLPQFIFTHVARLVPSKGLWRDLLVLEFLDRFLVRRGWKAVFWVLASEAGRRPPEVVQGLAAEYGWPLVHREGFPDLVGRELNFDLQVRAFNARSQAVKVLFVNQFGWGRQHCGTAMPAEMESLDLRRGTDVEFGQSIYEPFGIAQLEPLGFGAVCVVSDVCGCLGLVARSAGDRPVPNLICGEYTRLEGVPDVQAARALGSAACQQVEARESQRVAARLASLLENRQNFPGKHLRQGFELAARMSWERVAADYFLPAIERL